MSNTLNFVALDVETANPSLDSICQIGLAFFENGELVRTDGRLIDPDCWFDAMNVGVHGIAEADVQGKPRFDEVVEWLLGAIRGQVVVTHTGFDVSSVGRACERYGIAQPDVAWLDSAAVARRTWDWCSHSGYGLFPLCMRHGISFKHHDAVEDAAAAGKLLVLAARDGGRDLPALLALVDRPITAPFAKKMAVGDFEPNPDGDCYGQRIVFTGELRLSRGDAAALAAKAGFVVTNSVSKKVDVLVVGIQDTAVLAGHEKSSKHRKAEELQAKGAAIRVLLERDFLMLVGGVG